MYVPYTGVRLDWSNVGVQVNWNKLQRQNEAEKKNVMSMEKVDQKYSSTKHAAEIIWTEIRKKLTNIINKKPRLQETAISQEFNATETAG